MIGNDSWREVEASPSQRVSDLIDRRMGMLNAVGIESIDVRKHTSPGNK